MNDAPFLLEDEQIEELADGIKIIQKKDGFKYGTDAVLLSSFANVKKGEKCLDLCTGTAIIPFLLYLKNENASYCALEIQEKIFDMAKRSVALSGLCDKINIKLGDLKNYRDLFSAQSFDVVTCNPPYMPVSTGKMCESETERLSRHEILCNLEDVIKSAGWLLKDGGRFYMIHRADRLCDAFYLMRKYKIEPKRLVNVHPDKNKEAGLFLVEGMYGKKSGLRILKPIFMA